MNLYETRLIPQTVETVEDHSTEVDSLATLMRIVSADAQTEVADVIKVNFTATDGLSSALASADRMRVELFTDPERLTRALPAAFSISDGGAGTVDVNSTAASVADCTTDNTGALSLNFTDVVGGSGDTIYGVAKYFNDTTGGLSVCELFFEIEFD